MKFIKPIVLATNHMFFSFNQLSFLKKILFVASFAFLSWPMVFAIFFPDLILNFILSESAISFAKNFLALYQNTTHLLLFYGGIYTALSLFIAWFFINIGFELFITSTCYKRKHQYKLAEFINVSVFFVLSGLGLLAFISLLFLQYINVLNIQKHTSLHIFSNESMAGWFFWVSIFIYYFVHSFFWELTIPIYLKNGSLIQSLKKSANILHKRFIAFSLLSVSKLICLTIAVFTAFATLKLFISDFSQYGLSFFELPFTKQQYSYNGFALAVNIFISVLIFSPLLGLIYTYFRYLTKQLFFKNF